VSRHFTFFPLSAILSPIQIKVDFDMSLTLIADNLYRRLHQALRGFENCDALSPCPHIAQGKGDVSVRRSEITVTYPRAVHNPTLRSAAWDRIPHEAPWLDGTKLTLRCQ
jgi:hypothetical protein